MTNHILRRGMKIFLRILLTVLVFLALSSGGSKLLLMQRDVEFFAPAPTHAKMKDGMSGGWGKGYAIIDEILAELKAVEGAR